MAKLALMAANCLAKIGAAEPFVVRNCRYEMIIIRFSLKKETCIKCKGYEQPKHTLIASLGAKSRCHLCLLGSYFGQWSQSEGKPIKYHNQ